MISNTSRGNKAVLVATVVLFSVTFYLLLRAILVTENIVQNDESVTTTDIKMSLHYDANIVSKVNQYELDLKSRNLFKAVQGYSAQWPFEVEFYHKTVVNIATKQATTNINKPTVVCETGFNMGHSAYVFLASHPNVRYIGFDLGLKVHNPHQKEIVQFMKSLFDEKRFELILGDSTKTLANIAQVKTTMRNLFGQDYCDIVSVDGGHVADVPMKDLINFKSYWYYKSFQDTTFIFIDDCMCTAFWCEPVTQAWKNAQKTGLVKEIGQKIRDDSQRGLCWGHYLHD